MADVARTRARARRPLRRGARGALLPEGAEIFDAHLHLGHDIDGMVGDYDQLTRSWTSTAIARAFMFCLDEPDRHPGLQRGERPHARVRRALGGAPRPIRPARPERDADRGGDTLPRPGARGIKLHPRAQRFRSTDERLGPVFELAAERRVPILIHGGRGLPPIAAELRRSSSATPRRS